MNIGELVRESIEYGVDSLPKGEPQPVGTRSRRWATPRVALPAIVAAGVIAAVSVVAVDQFGSDEVAGPTVGATDDGADYITWSKRVHLDGHTYKAKHAGGETLGMSALTSAGFIYFGSDNLPHLIDRDGVERSIGDPGKVWSMAGSADHRYAAWTTNVRRGRLTVSLFDAEAGKVTAQRTIDCGSRVPDVNQCEYATVVADGVVYLTATSKQGPATVGWDPSLPKPDQVYQVTDPGTQLTGAAAKTVLVTGKGAVYDRDGDPVGDDWTVVPVKFDGSDVTTVLTANGRWRFTFSGEGVTPSEDTLSAVNIDTGESVELVAPAYDVRIDDDGSVLVMTSGNNSTDQAIFDCVLPSGECSTVVDDIGRSDAFAGSDS
ncbi:MAG: hypothetical protein L0K86_23305 [Actinomycetia bacterium]|nr:hypothetical protein [Actinomycetes bacterium]